MTRGTLFVLCALLLTAACDRSVGQFEQAVEAERAGNIDQARWRYLDVPRKFPQGKKAQDGQKGFVRLTLDMAQQSLDSGDLASVDTRLGEVQPQLSDAADKERFAGLQAALRTARITERQVGEVRQLFKQLSALAAAEKKAFPEVERQAAFRWADVTVPGLKPDQRVHLHLGRLSGVERTGFDAKAVKRHGDGQYVIEVDTETSAGAQKAEWFVQNTTNGWRLVCAQAAGASECKDPWVYKAVKP